MKHTALVLTLFSILAIVAAQIPLKPPPYYGAPKKKKVMLRRRDAGPHIAKTPVANVVSVEKPEIADAKQSEEQ
ncbi:hypothetical protein LY78DRAFT_658512 [Colletotrichum sublineola]|uniref:Uncharacterized protein n=1 Tax=Colletotrichum sublineola TaxID=1173701 RepID=A0A066WZ31_COLSU|nr:hypothetical protein LY78DRAFT_658512 [Colletotrichum sublineola]KDN61972.1 hypothetical protein CSUB01_05037 [Colletotrichum sublineola]